MDQMQIKMMAIILSDILTYYVSLTHFAIFCCAIRSSAFLSFFLYFFSLLNPIYCYAHWPKKFIFFHCVVYAAAASSFVCVAVFALCIRTLPFLSLIVWYFPFYFSLFYFYFFSIRFDVIRFLYAHTIYTLAYDVCIFSWPFDCEMK